MGWLLSWCWNACAKRKHSQAKSAHSVMQHNLCYTTLVCNPAPCRNGGGCAGMQGARLRVSGKYAQSLGGFYWGFCVFGVRVSGVPFPL